MRQLLVVPLPPEQVSLLERLESGEPANEWVEIRSSLEEQVAAMHCAHQAQDAAKAKTVAALTALSEAIEAGEVRPATLAAFRFQAAAQEFRLIGARLRQSSISEFNELQLACHASLRGQSPTFSELTRPARGRFTGLREIFESRREELPEPVAGALSLGFETTESSLNMLERWEGDAQQLKIILANLRSGARALEFLSDWESQSEDSEVLQLLQELELRGRLSESSLNAWPETFKRIRASWAELDFLMPVDARTRLKGLAAQQLDSLEGLMDMPPERQYDGLDRLQRLADEVVICTFDLEELREHPVPWLGDFVLACRAGGIPGFLIRETVAAWEGTALAGLSDLLSQADGCLRALEQIAAASQEPFHDAIPEWIV